MIFPTTIGIPIPKYLVCRNGVTVCGTRTLILVRGGGGGKEQGKLIYSYLV